VVVAVVVVVAAAAAATAADTDTTAASGRSDERNQTGTEAGWGNVAAVAGEALLVFAASTLKLIIRFSRRFC
jgi:hypothetical protein